MKLFLGTAEAYFVCHIGPNFQISLTFAFITSVAKVTINILYTKNVIVYINLGQFDT